jgi:hypothetical protein
MARCLDAMIYEMDAVAELTLAIGPIFTTREQPDARRKTEW